jgi:hypothetical protein
VAGKITGGFIPETGFAATASSGSQSSLKHEGKLKPRLNWLSPCSSYLLSGPARTGREHSIPGVKSLRYSVTSRNFRAQHHPPG